MNETASASTITTSSQSTLSSTAPTGSSKRRLRRVVAGSLAAGLVAGVLLVFAPFIPAGEAGATGALLIGFAFGWLLMALLSVRFTDQPQRWAFAPAAFMGLGGLTLIAFGSSAQHVLSWVWPPALLTITVWMVVQTRRQTLGAGARVLLYPVFAFLALASIGGGIETVLEAVDTARHPMTGEVVDVDGHGMHLSCAGTGSPTVVLEPGGGELSSNLGWITPAVARDTRVCVYDRPGRGWSDPTDTPQDGSRVAADLHTLLHAAHVPGPYLLAGHSFGGLYVLTYAARYPDEVAGMVLIDSTSPTIPAPQTQPQTASDGPLARGSALASVAARVGLGRLYSLTSYGDLPTQSRDEVRATISTAATLRSTIDEFTQASRSMQEAAELRELRRQAAGRADRRRRARRQLVRQAGQARAPSTNSVHRVVPGATHEMLVGDRTASAATIAAIRDVVSAIRSERTPAT